MTRPAAEKTYIEVPKLGLSEQHEVARKMQRESCQFLHSMVKIGALANIIGAFLYAFIIYSQSPSMTVWYWYVILVSVNMLNIIWAEHYPLDKVSHLKMLQCRLGIVFFSAIICLIWGSIGILFTSAGHEQEITTIIFLSAVLICFTFSTAQDLTLGFTSILCLLMPTILYHFGISIYKFYLEHDIAHSNISTSAALSMLGFFMLITSYIANKIITKVFRLGYENDLLRQKLEGMNAFLEERVQERTEKLESSLKLLTFQATHDLLTDLPNERLLSEHVTAVNERAVKERFKYAIACFSINKLGKISDSIGHNSTSVIIQRIAQRLADLYKDNKKYFISLSRRHVFVILIELAEGSDVERSVENMLAILDDPVYVSRQSLKLTGSFGVSMYPDHGRDLDTLITNAEAARMQAKKRGGNNIFIYNTIFNADSSRQLMIENLLYNVVDKNELFLNFQPFINSKTGRVSGVEALVRWKSPVLGLVSPLDFIPIAEANGMIIPIGEWVFRMACHHLKGWQRQGFDTFKLSVNLSAKQLTQRNLVSSVKKVLQEFELDPQSIDLELTESNAFQNEAIPIINEFSEMGISLSIDDFGTGYSEFSSLKLFNVEKIKIDRAFVQDLDVNIDSRNIVCNTISLAKRMNIRCIAEGVENIDQVKFLEKNGCYLMQGYYFSKPLSADMFLEFLKDHAKV